MTMMKCVAVETVDKLYFIPLPNPYERDRKDISCHAMIYIDFMFRDDDIL